MSDFKKCQIYGIYGWVGSHKCPPAYGVRRDDWDSEDEVEVYAESPEDAARRFLEERFADFEYPRSMTVIVNDWKANNWAGKEYTYEVTVEAQPVFYAELISEQEPTMGGNETPS